MKLSIKNQTPRWLLGAGLVLSVAAAHATSGITITSDQENLAKVGMSTSDVMQALGRPEQTVKYGNEPGPTWTYRVMTGGRDMTVFDVDFDANGKVASVDQRDEMAN
ncbi:MAG: hypothetical protein ABI606_07920 [Rhodoferax sp.]